MKTRPFGRMLEPADIARAVLFFATNELISGAVLDYEQLPFWRAVRSGNPGNDGTLTGFLSVGTTGHSWAARRRRGGTWLCYIACRRRMR